ncbi:hypothetical protein O7632_04180 [Solwaraspora sp. WMMD406]|uniref:hypothetical protein n=1 Tax=Solwaraspora sp. WMMD406 TaxID=3016095 RepID=UPI002415D6EB|nr:hypothetical protein [Solwaraspora sp. WMMD406]MDG4763309.1 hypothetical protein [Solwaraspora sp. WMMD406]
MTGVEAIIAALVAGAAAGSTDVARTVVTDTYGGLKNLLRGRLAGRPQAQEALEAREVEPGRWQAVLAENLAECGADTDERILAAARRLLELADPIGAGAGRYEVDASQARGVQVGDHNTQTNTFN